MKKTFLPFLMACLPFWVQAQKLTTAQDSINHFYDKLFFNLKKAYLHKDKVDWKTVEKEIKNKLTVHKSFTSALQEIEPLFNKIQASHCMVFVNEIKYAATGKKLTPDKFSEQWTKKYTTKPSFETKVIDEKYGYILLPRILLFDTSAKNLNRVAQPLYHQIAKLKTKNNLENWIIDLRFNTGGNAIPMLLALYDFLGDQTIWGTIGPKGNAERKISLDRGNYLDGNKKIAAITPQGKLLTQTNVAVLTGLATGSSGEITAMAFKGRPNTIFIGEETYGATTGNIEVKLPFHTVMALTTSYDCDRNGILYDTIKPDILVSKQDNFDNLLLDKNIQEAVTYFSTKSHQSN